MNGGKEREKVENKTVIERKRKKTKKSYIVHSITVTIRECEAGVEQ